MIGVYLTIGNVMAKKTVLMVVMNQPHVQKEFVNQDNYNVKTKIVL